MNKPSDSEKGIKMIIKTINSIKPESITQIELDKLIALGVDLTVTVRKDK